MLPKPEPQLYYMVIADPVTLKFIEDLCFRLGWVYDENAELPEGQIFRPPDDGGENLEVDFAQVCSIMCLTDDDAELLGQLYGEMSDVILGSWEENLVPQPQEDTGDGVTGDEGDELIDGDDASGDGLPEPEPEPEPELTE